MDRTVPKTGSEEIQLYMRTYYSLLRSTHTIQIETLVESHMAMESSLHIKARQPDPDLAAFIYASLRLPPCIVNVDYVLIGQIEQSFAEAGYANVAHWQRVYAPGRRRRNHFDGKSSLAVFVASRSDIDDLVPTLTAYQIEWNKMHLLLQSEMARLFLSQNQAREAPLSSSEIDLLAGILQITPDDLTRLITELGERFLPLLAKIAQERKAFGVRLLAGSLAAYRKATAFWWSDLHHNHLLKAGVDCGQCPVYFVSSNTHSLVNLLSGFAPRHETNLIEYITSSQNDTLIAEYEAIQSPDKSIDLNNFLYYVLRRYLDNSGQESRQQMDDDIQSIGIHRVPSETGFEIEAQVIEINQLKADWFDPRLCDDIDPTLLAQSNALILNIDYPLGMAAYGILNRVIERVGHLQGVYIMGKAATLNARVGDVMIPSVVHDEHSQNTYLFHNCFAATDVAPYMAFGMVLDNQKAISAPGTFLQNSRYMSVFYEEGYTDIEMESGPYLSSIYEAFRPRRHPANEIVDLHSVPFDVGFLHYASDRPMTAGENLGAGNLSYAGVDPTYATAIAILRRIFQQETQRIHQRQTQETPAGLLD